MCTLFFIVTQLITFVYRNTAMLARIEVETGRGGYSSSSEFDMMAALTRFFLPWVPHIWMSGTNPLQTPRAWFWGTHKWAISAALLADGVSRTVGSVLVFGPPLHRGIVRRSLRQSSWDGYSVCSGLFWGERWWSVGVAPADGARPGLGCILQSCSGRWLSFLLWIRVLTSLMTDAGRVEAEGINGMCTNKNKSCDSFLNLWISTLCIRTSQLLFLFFFLLKQG